MDSLLVDGLTKTGREALGRISRVPGRVSEMTGYHQMRESRHFHAMECNKALCKKLGGIWRSQAKVWKGENKLKEMLSRRRGNQRSCPSALLGATATWPRTSTSVEKFVEETCIPGNGNG